MGKLKLFEPTANFGYYIAMAWNVSIQGKTRCLRVKRQKSVGQLINGLA